ncbi:hypothetical protein Syn7502_01441 [Synechococcus sp. PCC 7502]|uniref:hypothetical protein n=1 Tax=Synechococcus sp. PCC 7502 TaxID=1173263 RepID=UPI00029FA783|nr:hypothetical protein [Synechococcus sp. PCC 7502]AFY73510.1 hypothetical protein Syn7502_01441 [Synechococcus sp. PCC 7502]
MKNKLSLITLLLLISCSLSLTSSTLAIEEMKPKINNLDLVANGGLKQELETIARLNPEVAGLKFIKFTDWETTSTGLGYSAKWYRDYFDLSLMDVYFFTLGRSDISGAIDDNVYAEIKRQISNIQISEQNGRYQNVQFDSLTTRKIGNQTFLYIPLRYSFNGADFNSVILTTAKQGKYINVRISSTDPKVLESIIQQIPHLLNSIK